MNNDISERDNLLFADLTREGRTNYRSIPRLARVIPFGYEIDPEDNNMLVPIPFQLDALVQAKKHLKSYSLREVATWLTNITGRSISHMGLKKRMEMERSRRTKASAAKTWLARAEKARKIFEYNDNSMGAKVNE